MNKSMNIRITALIIILILSALVFVVTYFKNTVVIPDLYNMEYGEVLKWGYKEEVDIEVSSDYTDEVEPNKVFFQSIASGTRVKKKSSISIKYSRGYNPEAKIELPDFLGYEKEEIKDWLESNDIRKYTFLYEFNDTVDNDSFIRYEIIQNDDDSYYKRKDTYVFYLSKGSLLMQEVEFNKNDTMRGVNLGGWFVLEGWMTPKLFEGVNGSDETIFVETKSNSKQLLEEHWDTFIVEEDFKWLSEHGIKTVRIPIPWWLYGDEPYHNSVKYIERALEWASKYEIKVLLDLHTAPGCQNGFDNGGITGVLEWDQPENVAKTVEVLGKITEHFSKYDSLWGIEVLNEPGWSVDMDLLQQFYIDAYEIIRKHNKSIYIGFHDGFRSYDSTWTKFFTDNNFDKVFFDLHLYQCFGDWSKYDINGHIEHVEKESLSTIKRLEKYVPIVIGEWSLGLQNNVFEGLSEAEKQKVREAYANAQLNAYDQAFGWYFWSYKIDRESHLEWDFRRLIEENILPPFYGN